MREGSGYGPVRAQLGPGQHTGTLLQAVRVRLLVSAALPCPSLSLHHLHLLPSMVAEMLELPDDLLLLIARQVLKREEGLRLWCKLSSACRRLWVFQLPSEPTYFLDGRLTDQGECCSEHAKRHHVYASLLLKRSERKDLPSGF